MEYGVSVADGDMATSNVSPPIPPAIRATYGQKARRIIGK